MKTLGLNDKWELTLDKTCNILIKEEAEALTQDLSSSLKLERGEDKLKTGLGLSWHRGDLFSSIDDIKQQTRETILSNSEVIGVVDSSVTYNRSEGVVTIENKINSVYGIIDL